MRITPMTMQKQQTQQNPSFEALKFKLDQKSKVLLAQTCVRDGYNAVQTTQFISNVDNAIKKLNNVAKVITQGLLDNNPKTRGLSVDDVWPLDTKVKLGISVGVQDDASEVLLARFSGDNFINENEISLPNKISPKCDGVKVKELTPGRVLSFIRNIPDERLKFSRYVGAELKKQPGYKMIDNNYENNDTVNLGSKSLNEIIRDWVYSES